MVVGSILGCVFVVVDSRCCASIEALCRNGDDDDRIAETNAAEVCVVLVTTLNDDDDDAR